jgi:hypothetical protein
MGDKDAQLNPDHDVVIASKGRHLREALAGAGAWWVWPLPEGEPEQEEGRS